MCEVYKEAVNRVALRPSHNECMTLKTKLPRLLLQCEMNHDFNLWIFSIEDAPQAQPAAKII